MKALATKTKPSPRAGDPRTVGILASLRDARKAAVKSAKLHGMPVVYLRGGNVVKARA